MGSCSWTNPVGAGNVKGMDELWKQDPYWPFLKYQATDLFQGLRGKELPDADMQRLMEHRAVGQEPGSAAPLSGRAGSLG